MAQGPLHGIEDTFARWGIQLDTSDVVPGHPRGGFAPEFVMIHHDAGRWKDTAGRVIVAPSRRLIRVGRKDVPPPLYHIYVRRDLKVELITRGRANHAGKGGPWRDLGKDEGNRRALGVCLAHMGKAEGGDPQEPVRAEFLELAGRVAAAACDHIDASAGEVLGHKEYTDRKPDPYGIHMPTFRADVGELLFAGPGGVDHGGTPPSGEGDDMIDAQGLRKLLETTRVGLGPVNARLLANGAGEITLDGLLVAIAGHTAAQSQQLERIADALEALVEHVPTFLAAVTGSGEEQEGGPSGG